MRSARRRIVELKLRKHAEIAAFLWGMRAHTVHASYANLTTLLDVDQRIDTHLIALRADPEAALEVCGAPDKWQPGDAFVGAWVAFAVDAGERLAAMFDVLEDAPDLTRPIGDALGWIPTADADRHVRGLLASESAVLRRVGLNASVARGDDPGDMLHAAIEDGDPILRSRALRAVGELGRADLRAALQHALSDKDDECGFSAAWSAVLLGELKAVPVLGAFAARGGVRAEQACAAALRRLSTADAYAAHREIIREFGPTRLPVVAAGMIGDPAFVEWLIGQMDDLKVGRAAGEAFSMITGADLAYDDLDGDEPHADEGGDEEDAGPTADGEDPDEGYLWPDTMRIADWWNARRRDFLMGTRYLLGHPPTREWLREVLLNGRQPHRASAALEYALAFPGRPLFDVRAPAHRQEQRLRSQSLERRVRRIEAG